MIHRCLSNLLIILIALQLVEPMADSHQSHQTGAQHLAFEHDHSQFNHENSPANEHSNLEDGHTDSSFDCHHCCHCHGLAHLLTSQAHFTPTLLGNAISDYRFAYFSHRTTPDNPPPIS